MQHCSYLGCPLEELPLYLLDFFSICSTFLMKWQKQDKKNCVNFIYLVMEVKSIHPILAYQTLILSKGPPTDTSFRPNWRNLEIVHKLCPVYTRYVFWGLILDPTKIPTLWIHDLKLHNYMQSMELTITQLSGTRRQKAASW